MQESTAQENISQENVEQARAKQEKYVIKKTLHRVIERMYHTRREYVGGDFTKID